MSFEVLLSQNKILAYFTLDVSVNSQDLQILQPSIYTTMIYHYHYPVIYFQQLYEHFKNCLPKDTKPGQLRICYNKKQLPSEMPIGLFIEQSFCNLSVIIEPSLCILEAFDVIKNSWKKTFEVINKNRKCDYIKTKITKSDQLSKYRLYKSGRSHNLHKQGQYEGTSIIVKGIYEQIIIERLYQVSQFKTIKEVIKDLFCLTDKELTGGQLQIKSHNIAIDLDMSTKIFLDEWNYNDGYCYIKLGTKKQI